MDIWASSIRDRVAKKGKDKFPATPLRTAIIVGAIAGILSGYYILQSPVSCYSGVLFNPLIAFGVPVLAIAIITKFLNYGYRFFLASLIAMLFVFFIFPNGQLMSCQGPICFNQPGYTCSYPVLHKASFSIEISQTNGTNWANTIFLWVPSGETKPSTIPFCPFSEPNSISDGIACYQAGNISSGEMVNVSFAFNTPIPNVGAHYTGQIYAEYQNATGAWKEVQIASGVDIIKMT